MRLLNAVPITSIRASAADYVGASLRDSQRRRISPNLRSFSPHTTHARKLSCVENSEVWTNPASLGVPEGRPNVVRRACLERSDGKCVGKTHRGLPENPGRAHAWNSPAQDLPITK